MSRGWLAREIARASSPWRRATAKSDTTSFIISSPAGAWDTAPLEKALLAEADRMVGGADAWLIVDDTALPKKGEHSVGVAPQYASRSARRPIVSRWSR